MQTPVTVKIKFKSETVDQFIERYAVDVSDSGIFIRTPKPLSVGTNLRFEFQLQDGSPLLSGVGTVVWVRERNADPGTSPGMGVRFDTLPSQSQQVLGQVLDHKKQASDFSDAPTRVAFGDELPTEESRRPDMAVPAEPEPAFAAPEPAQELPAGQLPVGEPEPVSSRKETLEKILFADDAAQSDGATGAAPLTEGESQADASQAALMPAEERASSGLVWLLIVLLVAAGAAAYWYYDQQKRAAVLEPTVSETPTVAPKPAPAPVVPKETVKLKVESQPEGAEISIDGKNTGKVTPDTLADLDPKKPIELTLDLPGKKLHRVTLRPTADKPYVATLTEPAERALRFTTAPEGAAVYLDGRRQGYTPLNWTKSLRKGRRYEVKFVKKGFKAQIKRIVGGELTFARDGDDEIAIIGATLEEGTAKRRSRSRPRRRAKPTAPDTTDDEPVVTDPESSPEAASDPEPEAEPAPQPAEPPAAAPKAPAPEAPAEEPAKKGKIRAPSWSE